MSSWFFIKIGFLLVAVATSRADDWFTFSKDRTILSKCIEDHLASSDSSYAVDGVAKVIADLAAKRLSGKTKAWKSLNKILTSFFSDLRCKKSHLFRSQEVLKKQLGVDLKKAVENCADDSSAFESVPIFKDELPEVADVLNYILVSWTLHPFNLVQTKFRRSLLRKYANDALDTLFI